MSANASWSPRRARATSAFSASVALACESRQGPVSSRARAGASVRRRGLVGRDLLRGGLAVDRVAKRGHGALAGHDAIRGRGRADEEKRTDDVSELAFEHVGSPWVGRDAPLDTEPPASIPGQGLQYLF